jgi:lipopolysaccharide/colanic/teichoic acid biosynthesis glycosyltransferase
MVNRNPPQPARGRARPVRVDRSPSPRDECLADTVPDLDCAPPPEAVRASPSPLAPLRKPSAEWPGRLLDGAVAALLLALSAPVILVGALLVKLTSRGPAFYRQVRVGRRRRPFTLVKLRTMTHNCEAATGAKWSTGRSDPRVTWVGRLLRRTHIDELPQLVNVLRGEMSLVGPRPERPEFVAKLEPVIPGYGDRLLVRPGLTGLAQIQLPPDTEINDVRRKVRYDLYHIRHRTLGLDLRILLGTAVHVVGLPFAVSRVFLGVPGAATVEADDADPRRTRTG